MKGSKIPRRRWTQVAILALVLVLGAVCLLVFRTRSERVVMDRGPEGGSRTGSSPSSSAKGSGDKGRSDSSAVRRAAVNYLRSVQQRFVQEDLERKKSAALEEKVAKGMLDEEQAEARLDAHEEDKLATDQFKDDEEQAEAELGEHEEGLGELGDKIHDYVAHLTELRDAALAADDALEQARAAGEDASELVKRQTGARTAYKTALTRRMDEL